MKVLPALFYVVFVFALSCGKDKFETKPRIELKSVNDREISDGERLNITMEFFDKEGDLGNGKMLVIHTRTNEVPVDKIDTFYVDLPEFPNKTNGEIVFSESHFQLKHNDDVNDNLQFKFAVTDKAGNVSDTISCGEVVIVNP